MTARKPKNEWGKGGRPKGFHQIEVGTPPCDDCPLMRRCEARFLACNAYLFYVNGSSMYQWEYHGLTGSHEERIPSRSIFRRAA